MGQDALKSRGKAGISKLLMAFPCFAPLSRGSELVLTCSPHDLGDLLVREPLSQLFAHLRLAEKSLNVNNLMFSVLFLAGSWNIFDIFMSLELFQGVPRG